MSSENVAHGKEQVRWCDHCGTLLLGGRCDRCGSEGRRFEINSPGDIRPAMGEGRDVIIALFKDTFGTSSPLDGKAIFLNKIPGEDRTDEIVAHGAVLGVVRFDILIGRLLLDIRQAGADLFKGVATKNIVAFGSMSGHLKGKVVPGENIRDVVGRFSMGDSVILKKGERIGAGIALADSDMLASVERAVKIRDINAPSDIPTSPDSDRRSFIECNLTHIKGLESAAVSDVRSFAKGKKQVLTVSFSGGKDSLAAFGIAMKAIGNPELLFVDTGLEFPETVRYVESFAEKNGLRLHKADAGNAFWENVDTFGPPAKDFRWCCKVCKLGPITEMISREFPRGTVTVEGNRMLESFARSRIGFVSKNPFVPNQTTLNPIRTWTAADVWGYIWMRGLDYNPLYERDFERIGCYLCASCLASEWQNTGRIHPDMYARWDDYLHSYAESKGLSKEFVDMGFWRWKVLPPKMLKFAEGLDLKTSGTSNGDLSIKMLKGASSCAAGGFSMEAVVTVPRNRDFSYTEDALRCVGDVRYSDEFEIALVKAGRGTAKLFGGGQVSIVADTAQSAEALFERSVKALLRAQLCTKCGICAKRCPRGAITIKDGLRVDPGRCNSCGLCESSCMVVHYFDKIAH